jgi:hypothetical protein
LADTKPINETHPGVATQRQPRTPLDSDVELIADFDLVEAKGINISEGGLAFELPTGLPFEMRIKKGGHNGAFKAELVWMKRLPDGAYRMGLKFAEGQKPPKI